MSYVDRLQPQIVLTSPSGVSFTAKWSGDNNSQEKDLGIFKTPGVAGNKIQDLKMTARSWPLTINFDGPDHDTIATQFTNTLSESGYWTVIHPVKGELTLIIVSFTEAVQPISSGGITTVTTEWIEFTEENGEISTVQLSGLAKVQDITLQSTGSDQLNNVVKLDTADKVGKFKNAVENVVTSFDCCLSLITDTVAEVQSQANSIKRGIDVVLADSPIDVLSVAGQIQALVALPNLIVTDISSKIDAYSRFAAQILEDSPATRTLAEINTAAVQEIALTAVIGAVGVASVTLPLSSRQTVIDSIESNLSIFNTVTDGLDASQSLYDGELLSRSYFSQSDSYSDSAKMVGLTLAYLIKSVFSLAVEKKIVLTEPWNPVMLAMQEYGGPGDGDANIDLFYLSNNLAGDECYLLPVGKEIVVYV